MKRPLSALSWGGGRLWLCAERRFRPLGLYPAYARQVRWVRSTGIEAGALWRSENRPPLDFVFIDANHAWEGISQDWDTWAGLVGPGGAIALHDSRSTAENRIEADSVRFTQTVVLKDARFRVIEEVDSLTVLERAAE